MPRHRFPPKPTSARESSPGPTPWGPAPSGVAPPPGTSRRRGLPGPSLLPSRAPPLPESLPLLGTSRRCGFPGPSLLPPRAPPLQPHLEVPPEVLAQGAEVGDILQRGFELQRNFLWRGGGRRKGINRACAAYLAPAPPLQYELCLPAPSQHKPAPLIPSWHELPPPRSSPPPCPRLGGSRPPPHPHSGVARLGPTRPGDSCGRCFPACRKR